MRQALIITIILLCFASTVSGQGFLKTNGKAIVDEKGGNLVLKGIGFGGWMLQEPYMLQLSKVAGTQTEIKSKIGDLIGDTNCEKFYGATPQFSVY